MREHLTEDEIAAYRARTATPEQFVDISNHIYRCKQCYRLVESPEKVSAALKALLNINRPEEIHWSEHLAYQELADFVDGKLDDEARSDILAHTEHCPSCNKELKSFGMLKLESDLANQKQADSKKQEGIKSIFRKPVDGKVLGLAILFLATSIMGLVYLRWNKARIDSLREQISSVSQENNQLRQRLEGLLPSLTDGDRHVAIDTGGQVTGLIGLPSAYSAAIREALTNGRLAIASAPHTDMGRVVGQVRGIGTEEKKSSDLLYPISTAVEETRPRFEWMALPGASNYTVLMRDLSTKEVIEGVPTTKTAWTAEKDLTRGHQYVWMVEAYVDGEHERIPSTKKPYGVFRVLDAQEAQEIDIARKSWGDSHLLMGLLYAKAGLMREADLEFRALAAANPESSAAKQLLAGVHARTVNGSRQK